jgi:hypothetical protein
MLYLKIKKNTSIVINLTIPMSKCPITPSSTLIFLTENFSLYKAINFTTFKKDNMPQISYIVFTNVLLPTFHICVTCKRESVTLQVLQLPACQAGALCMSHSSSPLCCGYFGDRLPLFVHAGLDHNSLVL